MSEHQLQVAVAHMLQVVLDPDRTWWSSLDHSAKLSLRYGAERKRRGVRRGLPDIMILTDQPGAYGCPAPLGIELKVDKGKLSADQIDVAHAWCKMGGSIFVARSLEEVQEVLEFCHVPMVRRMNFLGGGHEHPGRAARPRHPRARRQRKKPKGTLPMVLSRS